jgi:CheY-like chemotaxis protein
MGGGWFRAEVVPDRLAIGADSETAACNAEVGRELHRDHEHTVIARPLHLAARVDRQLGDADPPLVRQLADERQALADRVDVGDTDKVGGHDATAPNSVVRSAVRPGPTVPDPRSTTLPRRSVKQGWALWFGSFRVVLRVGTAWRSLYTLLVGPFERHAHSVLVVDDYDALREALVETLAAMGCDVCAARSGREALDILAAGLRPCVVFLDLCLPEMDGWTVWERMQAHREWSRTPVVMLSAQDVERERVRKAGIREFLRKPFDADRIIATVDQHCPHPRWGEIRPPPPANPITDG